MSAGHEARMLEALQPPERKVAMVLDTDTYNEIDDQFALSYAIHSPDQLTVKAVYAAPFTNRRSSGPKEGMERSYEEILRLLDRMSVPADDFVFKGAEHYLESPDTPVMSAAVDDMIAKSWDHDATDRLYVVAIGAITNVASALIADPSMIERVVVVWLGGHALYWPHTREFNLAQDIFAANVVFSSGVPLVQVPNLPVASHTLTSLAELERDMGRPNELCSFLIDRFAAYSEEHFAYTKELWDIAPIAWLLNAEWAPSHLDHSPIVQCDPLSIEWLLKSPWRPWYLGHSSASQIDCRYSIDRRRHLIRVVDQVNRDAIFADMFRKLSGR